MNELRLEIETRNARVAELERQLRTASSENEQYVARLRIELRETTERLQRSADEVRSSNQLSSFPTALSDH